MNSSTVSLNSSSTESWPPEEVAGFFLVDEDEAELGDVEDSNSLEYLDLGEAEDHEEEFNCFDSFDLSFLTPSM